MSARSSVLCCVLVALAVVSPRARADVPRFQATRSAAMAALSRVGSPPVVRWRAGQPTPSVVRGLNLPTTGADPDQRALGFVHRHPALVGTTELVPLETRSTRDRTVVRLQQRYRGVPVLDATVTVALDSAGHVRALHCSTRPVNRVAVRPRLRPDQAVRAAARSTTAAGRATLAVDATGGGRLVYVVSLPFTVDPNGRRHLVDARTGAYLGWRVGVVLDGRTWEEVRR